LQYKKKDENKITPDENKNIAHRRKISSFKPQAASKILILVAFSLLLFIS